MAKITQAEADRRTAQIARKVSEQLGYPINITIRDAGRGFTFSTEFVQPSLMADIAEYAPGCRLTEDHDDETGSYVYADL